MEKKMYLDNAISIVEKLLTLNEFEPIKDFKIVAKDFDCMNYDSGKCAGEFIKIELHDTQGHDKGTIRPPIKGEGFTDYIITVYKCESFDDFMITIIHEVIHVLQFKEERLSAREDYHLWIWHQTGDKYIETEDQLKAIVNKCESLNNDISLLNRRNGYYPETAGENKKTIAQKKNELRQFETVQLIKYDDQPHEIEAKTQSEKIYKKYEFLFIDL